MRLVARQAERHQKAAAICFGRDLCCATTSILLRRSMTPPGQADSVVQTKIGVVMPLFSFEIAEVGKPPFVARTQSLPDIRAAWCQLEALALTIGNRDGASIRVKNADGGIVILTGVSTALAMIDKCSRPDCPLKRKNGSSAKLAPMRTQPAFWRRAGQKEPTP
jgi:hypothetical protein